MSGLEVAGLVAAIVSAYAGATTLYRDWRKGRQARKNEAMNDQLQQVVQTSGPDVQYRYDDDFRRLGQVFARGDDIGRTALMQQLITLQQTVISLLMNRQASDMFAVIHPHHGEIERTSASVRQNSIGALGQQYQRLLQEKPIVPMGKQTITVTTWIFDTSCAVSDEGPFHRNLKVEADPTITFRALIYQMEDEHDLLLIQGTKVWTVRDKYKCKRPDVTTGDWNKSLKELNFSDGHEFNSFGCETGFETRPPWVPRFRH